MVELYAKRVSGNYGKITLMRTPKFTTLETIHNCLWPYKQPEALPYEARLVRAFLFLLAQKNAEKGEALRGKDCPKGSL